MPRPESERIIHEPPIFTAFKPIGVSGRALKQSQLTLDEFEAIRLADYEGLSHEEAAERLEVSRSTFTRLIRKARRKIAEFILVGKMLTIDGGSVHFKKNIIKCLDCLYTARIDINKAVKFCPECNSSKLENIAGSFGHGKCCWEKTDNK